MSSKYKKSPTGYLEKSDNRATLRQKGLMSRTSDLIRYFPGSPLAVSRRHPEGYSIPGSTPLAEAGGRNLIKVPPGGDIPAAALVKCPVCRGHYTFEQVYAHAETMSLLFQWKCFGHNTGTRRECRHEFNKHRIPIKELGATGLTHETTNDLIVMPP